MPSKKTRTPVEAAATLPGEYAFLSAIVADLPNDDPRLVYADWLEERGDPRAAYVRELVVAARSLGSTTKFPDARPYAPAWTNMLGAPLLEGIVEFDLVDVKDSVLRLARPIVTITTGRPVKETRIGVGASKFGGHPDLPAGADWPVCEEGPLGFLGQLAVGELQQTQVAHVLPEDGLLSFFAYQNITTGYQPGAGPAIAGDTRVLYTPGPETLEPLEPPDDIDREANGILPACRLSFLETWDLPDVEDKLPRKHAADLKKLRQGDRPANLHDLRGECHSFGHHLLGYSVHFRTDDPSPGSGWAHLLCLDSDDHLGWSWCDGEHLAVFVHEKDLRNRTFARVYGYAS